MPPDAKPDTTPVATGEYLTREQAAAAMGRSTRWIETQVARGAIRPCHIATAPSSQGRPRQLIHRDAIARIQTALPLADAARVGGVSADALNDACDRAELPFLSRVDGRFICRDDLDTWVAANPPDEPKQAG